MNETDPIFTFTGYDGMIGYAFHDDSGYRLVFGAMIYYVADKDELRNTVAWCICPVTFPEH